MEATAVRETSEEIGLALERDGELLGQLERARINVGRGNEFPVFPFVFALRRDVQMCANPSEVEAIVWARLDHLSTSVFRTNVEYTRNVEPQRLPAFDVEGDTVWGLTYRILVSLLGRVF